MQVYVFRENLPLAGRRAAYHPQRRWTAQWAGMKRFDGQVVVVTGAARGIGLAIAEAFGAEGAALALADVDEAALAVQAVRLADTHAVRTLAVAGDLSQEAVRGAVAGPAPWRKLGPPQVLGSTTRVAG